MEVRDNTGLTLKMIQKKDDQDQQQPQQQQQPIQPMPMPMPGIPDMNDPANIAMLQQQMMWSQQQMGMGMPQQQYDPTQFGGANPAGFYGGYPFMPLYGAPPMMMPQPYQPQMTGQFQAVGGSQQNGFSGPRPYPSRPYGGQQNNNYRGGYGGNQYGGSNHGSVGTGSKFNTQKFKTQLCRHFMQQGSCSQADSCLFAHGEHELRKITDPVPPDADAKAAIVQQNNQGLHQQTHHVRGGGGHHHHHHQNSGRGGYQQSNNYQGGGRGGSSHQGGGRGGYVQRTNGYQQNNNNGGGSQSGNQNFKTARCKNFDNGSCKYGNSCTFAHGDQDLRKGQGGAPSAPMTYAAPQQQTYVPMVSNPAPVQNSGQPIMAAGLSAAAFPVLGAQPNGQ